MLDLLIRAGYAITVDADRRVIRNATIAMQDGSIVGVYDRTDEPESLGPAKRTIDAPHAVAMPGLVDAHGHAGHGLVRTMADDLDAWMDACARLYLRGATPEFWYAEARLTAAERLRFGTTTSLSMLGGAGDTIRSDSPDHALGHVAGVEDIGLRTVVVVGPGGPPYPKETLAHVPGSMPTVVRSSLSDQVSTVETLATELEEHPHAILATTFPTLSVEQARAAGVADAARELKALADRRGLGIVQDGHTGDSVHASSELGLLGRRTLLSHATDLSDGAIDLLAASGTAIAHNPSAIFSQYGRCPVPELIEAGVLVGLGSDATAPDRSTDMFRHMFQLTRYHRADRRDPDWFPPGTAIEMATIGSASVLGLDAEIGSIEVGKRADIILVDTDRPHLTPFTHPEHQVVYFATGADVDTVIVDGEVRLEDGHLVDTDVPAILEDARRQQSLAFERVGLEQPPARPGTWGSVAYRNEPTA